MTTYASHSNAFASTGGILGTIDLVCEVVPNEQAGWNPCSTVLLLLICRIQRTTVVDSLGC